MALTRSLRIVIAGGTGRLGRLLARHFHERGHFVTAIGRHPYRFEWESAIWDGLEPGDWMELVDGADVVINLAGRNANCRFTTANRRDIKTSRVITTHLVGQAIARAKHPPAVWLNASTAKIYRHSLDKAIDESSAGIIENEPGAPSDWRFAVDVAASWERALFAAETQKTRRVAMRMGSVMSPDEKGAFARLLGLVRMGLGGPTGTGRQFVCWIHDVDFMRAVEFLIQRSDIEGPVNVCSPCPLPNREFLRCLRHAWCPMYIALPAPRWALALGSLITQTETDLLLKSCRVVPRRLLNAGFDFHFPNWRAASQDLICRWRESYAAEHLSEAPL
jgi:uncharacterized protein